MAKASVQVNNDLFYSYSDDLIIAHRNKRFAIKKTNKIISESAKLRLYFILIIKNKC